MDRAVDDDAASGRVRPWRVGQVEDHTLLTEGLRGLVAAQSDMEWVGAATTVDQLLNQHADLDVVVVDLWLGDDTSPQRNIERLNALNIRTLVYTSGEHPDLIRSAARAGVLGVLLKDTEASSVITAIRDVAQGKPVLSTEWAAAIDDDPNLASARLTPREEEVLTLIASGLTGASAARRLGIAADTVKDHIRDVRLKYAEAGRPAGAKADLVVRAVEDGYRPIRRRMMWKKRS